MAWPLGDEEEDSVPLVSLGRRRRIVCAASVSLAAVIAFVALSDVTAPEPSSNGAASMLVQTAGAWGNHRAMKPYTKQELSAAETGMAAAAAALQYVKPTQTEQLSSAPISGTPSVLHHKMADVWAERPNQPRQVGVPAVYAAAAVTEEQEQQEEQEKRDVQDVQEQQEQEQEQEQEQKQEQEEEEPSAPAPRSSVAASGDAADGQAAAGQENVVAGEDEGETMRKSPLEAAVDAAEAEEASQVRARAEQQQQQQDKAWEMEEEEEKQEKEKEEESAISSQQPESHPLADTPRFASPPSAGTPFPPYFFSSREGTHIVEQPLAPGEPYSVTGGLMQPVAETSPATEEGKQQQQPVYYPAPRRYVRITPTSSSNDEAVSDGVKPSAVTQAPSQSHGGLSSAEKAYIKKAVSDALERRRGQGSEGGWSYSPQAANGPSRWAQVGYPKCGEGARQSPINIEDGVRAAEMPTLAWQVPVESKQGGGSIVTIKDGAIELSGLEGLFSYGEAEYGLASARVHTPSEHAIGGVKLDMEVQFVHR